MCLEKSLHISLDCHFVLQKWENFFLRVREHPSITEQNKSLFQRVFENWPLV